jgi:DNA-binding NarL/FixJ family response regulator
MPILVAIVEDQSVTLEGLKSIIDSSDKLFCCGTFENAELFSAAFKHLDVQVVLMDINLPGSSGIECVEKLKQQKPEVQFLMCTNIEDADKIFSALKVGATGYLVKNTMPEKIIEAIIEVNNGGSPMSPQIARKVTDLFRKDNNNSSLISKLTPREKETIEMLSQGFPYKIVADKLGIKVNTVNAYIRSIYEKLQVHNRTDAINLLFPRT